MTIRAVSFDLDDTLWPVWPAIVRAEQALQAWLAEHAAPVADRFPPERMRELRPKAGELAAAAGFSHDLAWTRRTQIGLAFAATGHPASEDMIATGYQVFEDARQLVEPYPEVDAVLATIAARLPLVAVTNGSAEIDRTALGRHFKGAFSATRLGIAKPDAGIFHAACRLVDCQPHEVLHVGDDPHLDIAAARAAGMPTLWINRSDKPWPFEGPSGPVAADLHGVLALLG